MSGKLSKLLKENKLQGTSNSAFTRHYLDTGYGPLNSIISRSHRDGLPSGQCVMIAGPSACGKTMITTQLMISAQRAGGYAAFFDYETQYQQILAELQGLDPDEEKFGYYKPDTFEEGVSDAIKLAKLIRDNDVIPREAPIVFVFDSLQAMTPQSKRDSLMDAKKGAVAKGVKLSMHDNYALATACSAWMATISREFDKYGVTGIFINQVREETDMYGNVTFTFPGGKAAYYYCSTVLVLTAKDFYEGKGDEKLLTHKDIKCFTEKSRNNMPKQNVHWTFKFDEEGNGNFDVVESYVNWLLENGGIETAGAWIKFQGKSIQGAGKVVEYFRNEPDGLEQLRKLHDEVVARKEAEKEKASD